MKSRENMFTNSNIPLGNMSVCGKFCGNPSNSWIFNNQSKLRNVKVIMVWGKNYHRITRAINICFLWTNGWMDGLTTMAILPSPFWPLHCTCWEGPGPCFHNRDGQPSSSRPAWRSQTIKQKQHYVEIVLFFYANFQLESNDSWWIVLALSIKSDQTTSPVKNALADFQC